MIFTGTQKSFNRIQIGR